MKIKRLENTPLLLTNNGSLNLFFVGVGSAFSKKHFQTNLLIIKGNDHLLIDCGTKTPQALHELGLSITDIRNYLITHSHADHIGGLEEVMLMGRYVKQVKPIMIINELYQQILWNNSLCGGAGYNEEEAGKMLGFGDLWETRRPKWLENFPRETMEANIGSINLKIFRTKHIPDTTLTWETAFWSCGCIIDDRIMFTSDTKFDGDLIDSFCKRFELEAIFHDCQFFTGGVHASIEELNTLPTNIKKKIILTHYGDSWEAFEPKIKEYGFHSLGKQWHFYDFG